MYEFLDFLTYVLTDLVTLLLRDFKLPGVGFTYGSFLVACGVLSVVIGALVTQLRGSSLTPEAGMGNRRDSIQARHAASQRKSGGDA